MNTKEKIQYSKIGQLVKRFLHTKIGAYIGFFVGISGFNQIIVLKNGESVSRSYNSRVRKGGDLCATLIAGSAQNSISGATYPLYIALSTSSLTPGNTDTTLSGETAVSGLTRALGTVGSYVTPSVLDGACSYVLSKTFTAAGGATIVSAAIFDAVSTGNLFVEGNLSGSVVLVSGDLITIQWTINL